MKYTSPLVLGLLLVLAGAPCWGQQSSPCKLYFKVIQSDPRIPGSPFERLSESQEKWLHDKASKKYPSVCFNPGKAAYALVWYEVKEEKTNTRPIVESVTDANTALVGSTTTYYIEKSTVYVIHVSVAKIAADGKLQDPPLFVDRNPAHSPQASSSAAGLEHGMKFLSTLSNF